MLNTVKNNPYRFLGVFSNSPTKDRVANVNRLKAYLKVGKTVGFSLDLVSLLQPINRTVEGMDMANSSINLPKDQIKHGLFWFINVTSIDKIALDHLQQGNSSKAKELFNKRDDFSSLINRGVLAFIEDDLDESISSITQVVHNDEMRESFVSAVCGSTFSISEEDLSLLFMQTLLEEIPAKELKQLFLSNGSSYEDDDFLSEQSVKEPIAFINSAISKAKNVDRDDADGQYDAGVELMNSTKEALSILEEHFFTGEYENEEIAILDNGLPIQCPRKVYDDQYVIIADGLAKQILQCGINYYNNSDEDEYTEVEKAFELQNYALSIAVGKLTKDRCKENVRILSEKKESLPPKEVKYYDKLIKDAIAKYMANENKISYAINLIKTCVPYLMSIKELSGCQNEYYLKTSTLIVNLALHNVIEEFNSVMNDDIKLSLIVDRANTITKIKKVFGDAWRTTLYMDKLDMEPSFKNGRYRQNRESLKSQVKELINIYETVELDMRSETQIFNDCITVSDYDNYKKIFPRGKFTSKVKERIEKCEFDNCRTVEDCRKFKDKYPNSKLSIDDKMESCLFRSCKTRSQYKSYLKAYPNGQYTISAKDNLDRLSYMACKSFDDFKRYVSEYPNGKYIASANENMDRLSYEACKSFDDFKKYVLDFPNGQFRDFAKKIIDDEETWKKCISLDSKDLYKQYLAKYPNGRHKTEAEQKASACYIATMVYGDYNHPQVIALRGFRDNTLRNYRFGRAFIEFYYKNSPSWVEKMKDKRFVNVIIRKCLDKFIKFYNNENM